MDEQMDTLRKNMLLAIDAYIEGAVMEHCKKTEEQKYKRQHAAFEAWHAEVIRRRQMES